MALIWSQDFAAGNSATSMKAGTYSVTGWRAGSDSADATYPDIKYSKNIAVTTGTGPGGENVIRSFDATLGNSSTSGVEFGGIGALSGGDYNANGIVRLRGSVYFDSTYMDVGYSPVFNLFGYNATGPNQTAGCTFVVSQSSGDTWALEMSCFRWNQATYTIASHTFSRAATVGQWHAFELIFKHCTVNNFATDDVELDGYVIVKWNGSEVYNVDSQDFRISSVLATASNWSRGASVGYGLEGFIGPATNFELHDSLTAGRDIDLTTRFTDYIRVLKTANTAAVDVNTLIRDHQATVIAATDERADRNTQYDEYFEENLP